MYFQTLLPQRCTAVGLWHFVRLFSAHSLAFTAAIVASVSAASSTAHAQQVRLGGGGGSPVTVEFLEDIVVTVKPGVTPFFAASVGIQLNNVIGDGTGLGFDYNQTATPSNILDYIATPTAPLVSVSGSVAYLGNLSQGSDFQTAVVLPTFVQFESGGSFTFKAGSIAWPSAGTVAPWVPSPQTITLTPDMLFVGLEGTQYLTSNDVTVSAVPEPSTYAMALAGVACGGFSMVRRRKRA